MSSKIAENKRKSAPSGKLKDLIIESILDKKGEAIVSLDLRKINDAVCDYFVICEATTTTQVKAIAEHVVENVREKGDERPWHKEGFQNLDWILLDYVDVVVHVFRSEIREFYQLEELWADAERTEHE